ncbi:hypothetical protein COB18_01135 [Candidatus Kaiserbacteria bacterium]|nr:MAG: hypothetical protein COB18_01135 [Candidatus Kaiserbacteria bacterium]
MNRPVRTHVTQRGQDISITVHTEEPVKTTPVSLLGGEYIPNNAVSARTAREIQKKESGAHSGSFSDPKKNVHHFGLREGARVADFGSGSGAYTLALAALVGSTGAVYAVDVQRDLLTRIQNTATAQGYQNVEIIWGNIELLGSVGLRDEQLTAVLLANTLFQVDDKISTLKEAWRVLQPGGSIIIIDWTDSYEGLGPQKGDVVTQAEITLLCADHGFAYKRNFDAGEHHYGLIFTKALAAQDAPAAGTMKKDTFITDTISQELI